MADFASRYISEVESGKGLFGGAKAAIEGTSKDVGKKFSKENIVRSTFGGDDIFSALIRSKLGVKKKPEKEKAPTKEGVPEGGQFPTEGITFLKIIAKNTMSLPWMARDMNVLRQNLQKLVKIKAGPQKKGTKAYATGADAYFLKEDEREAALEAERAKREGGTKPTGAKEEKEGGGGLMDSIMSMFTGGFMKAIRFIFNPKNLVSIFKKVFLPVAIIGTLFSGIKDGFQRYKETGNFSDAIVAGLGGMLEFLTFGLFGEDTLKKLFASISEFFAPISETISKVFTGIKDFIKGLFGGTVDVKEEGAPAAAPVRPEMPDPAKFTAEAGKAAGMSEEKSKDLSKVFGAVQSGDTKGLFEKAQAFSAKYPEAPVSETSPSAMTSGGVPADQAQRNYELNKQLTGEASKLLGVPLQTPAPPTPVTSSAPVQTAPAPASNMSDADKIKQLEGYIENNKQRFAKRESDAQRHIDSFKKRYSNDPERVKELEDSYKQTLSVEKKEMENANAGFQNQIDTIKKSSKATVMASSASSPSIESGGESSTPASEISGGVGGGAGGSAEPIASAAVAPSGSNISQASSQVAEGQRMESAADMGSIFNAPTTNNVSDTEGKPSNAIADAYDTEFAKLLATTA